MIIGLTGGIGSGKSLVSGILEQEYGFHVIQTDVVARRLMNEDRETKKKLAAAFGTGVFLPDGTLNRAEYASVIYGDSKKQKLSDSIVHPAVWEEVRRMISAYGPSNRIAVETALPGKELALFCDEVWHVHSSQKERISRLVRDRSYTVEYAESIMKSQPEEMQYASIADRIIENDGSIEKLREEIGKLI